MTDDLVRRVWEHRKDIVPGFTGKYGVKTLVWYELHESRESAFLRERGLEKWNRAWKIELIERMNPTGAIYGLNCHIAWVPAFAGTNGWQTLHALEDGLRLHHIFRSSPRKRGSRIAE